MALDRGALYLQLLAGEHLTGDETLLWWAIGDLSNGINSYVYCRDCTRDYCLDQKGASRDGLFTWKNHEQFWGTEPTPVQIAWIPAGKFQDEKYTEWECSMCRKSLKDCRVEPPRPPAPAIPGQ